MKKIKELINRFLDFLNEVLKLEEDVDSMGFDDCEQEGGCE